MALGSQRLKGFLYLPLFQQTAQEWALSCSPSPVPWPWVLLVEHPQTSAVQEFCCCFLAQVVIGTNVLAAGEHGGSQALSG